MGRLRFLWYTSRVISPSQDPEPVAPAASLLDEVDVFFRPGGKLEKACANEPFPYEPRPQQRQMADAVAEAIAGSQHLAVEAGTGVGKSFAYLVPAILAAKQTNTKVVISTYTISLQEQLMYKDIPFLQEHLGIDFRATLVKGRGNYLCLRRMARAKKMAGDLFKRSPEAELSFIRRWAGETEEGSLQDLVQQPSSDVWQLVCAEQGNCTWQQCPEFAPCFFMKARARMQEADILIVNHHLFFSDLALRGAGAGFLPDYDVVVLDEAHCVEGVATEHMGLRLSHRGFEHWLRRIFVPDTGKGLLGLLRLLTTRRYDVAHYHAGGQMNHCCTVFDHLFPGIFDISTGAAIACGESDQFKVGVRVDAERALFVPHGPQALPACTAAIAVTDNDADFRAWIHFVS